MSCLISAEKISWAQPTDSTLLLSYTCTLFIDVAAFKLTTCVQNSMNEQINNHITSVGEIW